MKILINGACLAPPLTGIGHYTNHLIKGLEKHSAITGIDYFGLPVVSENRPDEPKQERQTTKQALLSRLGQIYRIVRTIPGAKPGADWLYNKAKSYRLKPTVQQKKPQEPEKTNYDNHLYHETNNVLTDFHTIVVDGNQTQLPKLCITTIHDLSWVHYPQFHPEARVKYMNEGLQRTIEGSKHIITVSQFVKNEIVEMLGVPAEKITTVYNGVDGLFHPRDTETLLPVLQQYGVTPHGYLLIVGSFEPRKNLLNLITAYSKLPQQVQLRYPLVHVGPPGWCNDAIEKAITPLLDQGKAKQLGYVSAEHLPFIQAGARGLAFPSWYEGFGLPIVEAMACGVPVLTSNRSSMAEVAGEAAILIEPDDVEAMTAGLKDLLTNDHLHQKLSKAGLKRASNFNWDRCVNETAAVYSKVLRDHE
ncbi:MAG: glycosyltransferase family 4 protein [Magnetococcales bacterium]|nr:glycosyltransferase family 4 protein [Magnetococcales bacterium]